MTIVINDLENSWGYKRLREAVDRDLARGNNAHDYQAHFNWVIERVKHYAEVTDVDPVSLLAAWEKDRTYWYMNYYQESRQPRLDGKNVRIFDTPEDLFESVGDHGFRCPNCNGVTKNPYECESGVLVQLINAKPGKRERCDWKVYGLFGALGKGATIFIRSKYRLESIFMPVAWEKTT